MHRVVSFAEYRFRETIAVLRSLTRKAVRGEVLGLAVCVITKDGEQYAFTGSFKEDSAIALKAANRISWKLNKAMDALEAAESTF